MFHTQWTPEEGNDNDSSSRGILNSPQVVDQIEFGHDGQGWEGWAVLICQAHSPSIYYSLALMIE